MRDEGRSEPLPNHPSSLVPHPFFGGPLVSGGRGKPATRRCSESGTATAAGRPGNSEVKGVQAEDRDRLDSTSQQAIPRVNGRDVRRSPPPNHLRRKL